PYSSCKNNNSNPTNNWTDYKNEEVFGIFACNKIDDINFTLIIAQNKKLAFSVIDNLTWTISAITLSFAILLTFGIFKISRSITLPIKLLQKGAQDFGKGQLNNRIKITTGDELEELGNTFNDMVSQVNKLFSNLKSRDIELHSEKETIAAERNKLKLIISGITEAVIAVDLNQNIVTFNSTAETITGFKEIEVLNQPIDQVITFYQDETKISIEEYCLKDNSTTDTIKKWNKIILKVAGKEIPINLISGKIPDGNSINLSTIITIHDTSSEKQLEDMKLDFVSMAAHELRTPITSIRGYTSVLEEEIKSVDIKEKTDWLSLLSRVSISSEQLLALVENLLNVTKIEEGVMTITSSPINWSQCLFEVVDSLNENARNKKIKLILEPVDKSVIASVDKMRINEVTINLISNAINYTPEGGTVTISSKLSDDVNFIETSVKDNGQGIPIKSQTHLFEKFFRVSGPLEQGSKGNGLGLYISKSIVTMHGGKIWVISDQGKGADFKFTVPVATDF
ncbi:MAG: ATP-binding protein, partial [bacterium]|nr:ATP-binding protein [bacterium]